MKISEGWPGLWRSHIEAGFAVPRSWNARLGFHDDRAYFFKGDEFIRYNVTEDKIDPNYPKIISQFWPGLGKGGINGIVVHEEDGIISFFKENEYVAYNIFEDKIILRRSYGPHDFNRKNPFVLQLKAKSVHLSSIRKREIDNLKKELEARRITETQTAINRAIVEIRAEYEAQIARLEAIIRQLRTLLGREV